MAETLRLATRRSKLALAQARAYGRALCSHHDGMQIEELLVVTSGDRIQDKPLQDIGGKGLFIKEIEEALLAGQADFAVHSIKDVPGELAPGLRIAAVPLREDPRDVLVSRDGSTLATLPRGAKVGTSSLRRRTMLLRARPDLLVGPLRGNVDTRLRKLDEGEVDAIVLAAAGLRRLNLQERASEVLSPDVMLPAVGQGALGIECRAEDEHVAALLAATIDEVTDVRVAAERAVMVAVGGSCQLPVAAYAEKLGDQLRLRGMLADPDGEHPRYAERSCGWTVSREEAARLGHDLGEVLRRG